MLVLCALAVAGPARSQELEPRAYSPAPIGARIALAHAQTNLSLYAAPDTFGMRVGCFEKTPILISMNFGILTFRWNTGTLYCWSALVVPLM